MIEAPDIALSRGDIVLPPLLDLDEFLELNHECPPCVVHQLLPVNGLSILAAEPKAGKSTLVRNLILSVARGLPFLGRETMPGLVLYYPLEEPGNHVGYEFTLLGAKGGRDSIKLRSGAIPKDQLHIVVETDIATWKPSLVVIDPLFDAIDVDDSNSYTKVNKAMKELLYIARSRNTHVCVVHHANKGEGTGIRSILGSQAFAGATDCNMILRVRGDGTRQFESIQRVGEPIEMTTLHFDPDTRQLSLGTGVKDARLGALHQALLDALSERPMNMTEWRASVSGRNTEKAAVVKQLEADGLVEQFTEGRVTKWRRIDLNDDRGYDESELAG